MRRLDYTYCTLLNTLCGRLRRSPLVQVPVGFSPIAFITSIPGLADGQLQLTPAVLAAIFQCDITLWSDSAIQSLNPGLQCAPPSPQPPKTLEP